MARGFKDHYTGADSKIGTGAADDFYFEHDGTNSNITNTTGNTYIYTTQATKKTIIDNGAANNQYVFDHDTGYIGVGINPPQWRMHFYGDSGRVASEHTAGIVCGFSVGSTAGRMGTYSLHPLKFVIDNVEKMELDTIGNLNVPAAYSTVIGGTNTDLFIDNSGLIGPSPCSVRYKENIVDAGDTSFIYSLKVRNFDYIEGPSNQVGFIAEEMQAVFPAAVRYAVFKKIGETWEQIDRTRFQNIKDAEKIPLDVETSFDLEKVPTETDLNPAPERATIKRMPNSVNLSSLIAPMLKEIQNLKAETDILKTATLQELIQGANVKDSAKKKAIKALGIK